MPEDYQQAAKRHWTDADMLEREARIENADQLYGLSAECALKYALLAVGRFRDEAHKEHINVLWTRIQSTAFHRRFPGLAHLLAGQNSFSDWHINQRYWEDGAIDQRVLEKHKTSTKRLLRAANIFRG